MTGCDRCWRQADEISRRTGEPQAEVYHHLLIQNEAIHATIDEYKPVPSRTSTAHDGTCECGGTGWLDPDDSGYVHPCTMVQLFATVLPMRGVS